MDLKCSIEEEQECSKTFESYHKYRSKKIEPSETDIKALVYKIQRELLENT